MATRSMKSRKYDPFHPVHGYLWASQLKRTVQYQLAQEGRSEACLEQFLAAYYEFGVWDGLLIRARAGVLNSVEVEIIMRQAVDPRSVAQIEARRDAAWRNRELSLRLLFDGETPSWMVPLLDWVAQVRSTGGY